MAQLRLSEIWLYPVKSLQGFRATQSLVMEKGLQYDRRWMLVDEHGKFMTQRKHPELALFQATINGPILKIHHFKTGSSIDFSADSMEQGVETVVIWHDMVEAVEVSKDISAWFTEQLKTTCSLVFFPETNKRLVDQKYSINYDQVSLADGYPFLIVGQASLDDLNNRLKEPVTVHRFRPNFVFTGGAPYEEDHWRDFTIGSNRFLGVKNCSRCILTTNDPNTAQRGEEPLRTLSKYRKRDSKVYFGQNAIALDHHFVNEGDLITL